MCKTMIKLWVLTLICCVSPVINQRIQEGGIIEKDTVIHEYDTPMLIQDDLRVAKEATLTLQPGVELRFAPGVMLAVNGTLVAKVNSN